MRKGFGNTYEEKNDFACWRTFSTGKLVDERALKWTSNQTCAYRKKALLQSFTVSTDLVNIYKYVGQ